MTYKQIEQAREMRLWIRDIVVPATLTITTILSIPEVRQSISIKATEIKSKVYKFKGKIVKKEES